MIETPAKEPENEVQPVEPEKATPAKAEEAPKATTATPKKKKSLLKKFGKFQNLKGK